MDMWKQDSVVSKVFKAIEKFTVSQSDSIIALSPKTEKYLYDEYQYKKTIYIPNSVDLDAVKNNLSVVLAAADTFRAAAIEQVEIWANRANASIVKHKEGADPAAVAYDGVEASLARNIDIVLIDTAGRLHTQKNLMEELKKIKRSINKKLPGAPHEVLMVLDATTGQNAISQATLFNEAVGLTQIALTKLDGTAKGGIVAAIASTMKLPIKYIGVGEQIEDLQDFDSKLFINALFD